MIPTLEKAPAVGETDLRWVIGARASAFMFAFWGMSKRPDRGRVGFDHEALEWISKVWAEAARYAVGNWRLRQAFEHERDRYAKLAKDLKDGEQERQDSGAVFLNHVSDWPREPVIKGAIKLLAQYEPPTLQ